MYEPKISLSFIVPGAKLLSSQVCEENPKKNYETHKIALEYEKGKGKFKKKVVKIVEYQTRKAEPVTHHVNMSKEAYEYMLSTPSEPKLARPTKRNRHGEVTERVWDVMSINERLKHYFDILKEDFNAISYSYEILED